MSLSQLSINRERRVPSESDPITPRDLKPEEFNNNNYNQDEIQRPILPNELYRINLLKSIDFTQVEHKFKDGISFNCPGNGLTIRPLLDSDFDLGYTNLLSQLTNVGQITKEMFTTQFYRMKTGENYYITVIEDKTLNRIAASATLLLENKFIHECGIRGRIEDVVVHDFYRGKQLGKLLVEILTLLSKNLGCYKTSLECKDKLIEFYAKMGYEKDPGNNFMVQRFDKPHSNL